jgi:hypothetical protein
MLLRVYETQILNIEVASNILVDSEVFQNVAKTDEVGGYEKTSMRDDWES